MSLALRAYTATTALGPGCDALWRGIRYARPGLVPCDFDGADLATWIGRVPAAEAAALPPELAAWDCRNNRLAELGLTQDGFADAVAELVATTPAERIGLFLGTSTSGIGATEAAFGELHDERLPAWFDYARTHAYYSLAGYLRARFGLTGPSMVVSTACSSSAKVFATAARWIEAGFCDAAIVGGVDSLCLTTLYGFNSLQLVSAAPCRPGDVDRDGLSIGEAAGFAIVAPPRAADAGRPAVLGAGESADAHHMAQPEPNGAGAELAMRRALAAAGVDAGAIDYCNLHGTATPANDVAEARAVARVLGARVPAASTKGWTGHALGAAGIVEAVIGCLAIENDWLPHAFNTTCVDPALGIDVLTAGRSAPVERVLSNAFGFGGTNASLVLGALR